MIFQRLYLRGITFIATSRYTRVYKISILEYFSDFITGDVARAQFCRPMEAVFNNQGVQERFCLSINTNLHNSVKLIN